MEFIDLKAQYERIKPRIDRRIHDVLAHGKFIMGPEVAELEAALSDFCGAKHTISCSSGTDALLMPLMAWGIGPGDAVFVPAFTFAATAEVVALLGATPVFVDVRRDTFNMDVESLKAAILHAKSLGIRSSVIIPVGLFGQPADMDRVLEIARAEDLKVLDDAAQSFGASYKGRNVGTLADATATSFFPAKPFGCYGDGGAVFTDDDELAEIMRSIRVHGKGRDKYDNVRIGLNARLDTIQAAILLEKLAIFPDELEARQKVASKYNELLADFCEVPHLMNEMTSAWAQYTIKVDDRDKKRRLLKENAIPSAVYYPAPMTKLGAYRAHPVAPGGVPNSKLLCERVLSLPMHPYLSEDDIFSTRQIFSNTDSHKNKN